MKINMTNTSWKFQGKPTNRSNFIFRERSKFTYFKRKKKHRKTHRNLL